MSETPSERQTPKTSSDGVSDPTDHCKSAMHPSTVSRSCACDLAGNGSDLELIEDDLGHRRPTHIVYDAHTAGRFSKGPSR